MEKTSYYIKFKFCYLFIKFIVNVLTVLCVAHFKNVKKMKNRFKKDEKANYFSKLTSKNCKKTF